MDAQRYGRLEALFREVCDLPQAERTAAIAAACGDDATLAADLKALLAAAPGAEDFFDALAERCGPRPAPEGASILAAGTRIGAWRIEKPLGAGGMGVVYEAERADGQFAMRAALKIVSVGLASKESRDRFVRERDILAGLDHPGLAHMVDGGVTNEGLPYFVMEYVDGQPIDRYCDQRQLIVSERLALVRQVLKVVQYAHRNLVVHRDLKPSNILVTAEGRVKLLDFGIAKVLDPARDTGDPTELTRAAGFPMTPAWASPEQCRGEAITTASDVYTLGVLLYLLLTGRSPYSVTNGSPAAWREAICEQPATTPSLRVRQPPDNESQPNPETIAVNRGATPERLSRRLKGDLDNILLVALRKEPERRYATVEQLAADLRRHAEGRPVEARPDTWQYRAGKFLRRHWIGAGATALVALAVLAGLGGTIWQARLAEAQAARAATEAGKALQVKTLVLRLFEGADPHHARGEEFSARELLDRGWAVIEHELSGQPDVQVELLGTVGTIYLELGLYDRAESLLEQALRQARELWQPNPEMVNAALRNKARLLSELDRWDEAEALLQEALVLGRANFGDKHADIAENLAGLGRTVLRRGNFTEAETLFQDALMMQRALFGDEHETVAQSLHYLGTIRWERGDFNGAERLLLEALELRRNLLPDRSPRIASIISELALLRANLGQFESAEELYLEALEILEHSFGPDHPEVAITLNNLAQLFHMLEDYNSAEPLLRRALDIRRRAYGDRHRVVGMNLNDLGRVLYHLGDFDAAEDAYREALEVYPPGYRWRSTTVFNQGLLFEARGDLPAAERHYRQALAEQLVEYGEDALVVGIDRKRLGIVLHAQGELEAAEAELRRSAEILRRNLPQDHPRLASALLALGALLADAGLANKAEPLLREAFGIRQAAFGDSDYRTIEISELLARVAASEVR